GQPDRPRRHLRCDPKLPIKYNDLLTNYPRIISVSGKGRDKMLSNRIRYGVVAATIGACLALSSANAQVSPPKEPLPEPTAADRALLKDAIDVHTHLDPDSFGPHSGQAARALDVIDMAKRAHEAGMRGFVIKQHYDQTAQMAYLAN